MDRLNIADAYDDLGTDPYENLGKPENPILKKKDEFVESIKLNNTNSFQDRLLRGILDPLVGLNQLVANSPLGSEEDVARVQKQIEANKGQPYEGLDVARGLGNMVMTAPLAVLPGTAGSIAAGAASAAVMPQEEGFDWGDKALETGLGGILGAVLNPQLAGKAGTEMLRQSGVKPSVGQAMGGLVGRAIDRTEQALQSAPVIGDVIRSTREAARNDFRQATLDRVAKDLGQGPLPRAIGQEGLDNLRGQISAVYDDAKNNVKELYVDRELLMRTTQGTDDAILGLTKAKRNRFADIVNNGLRHGEPAIDDGMEYFKFTGDGFKKMDRDLGYYAHQYSKSMNPEDRELGKALKAYQDDIRSHLTLQDQKVASDLFDTANSAYSSYKGIEKATERALLQEGKFTPGQLLRAVKGTDMEPWAKAGMNLGDTLPNSGTIDRGLATGILGGGLGLGHIMGAPGMIPTAAIIGGLTAGGTRPAQSMILEHLLRGNGKYKAIQEVFPLTSGPLAREWERR